MRKSAIILASVLCVSFLFAQERMYIHKTNHETLGASITAIDSIYMANNNETALFSFTDSLASFPIADIDSITFGDDNNIYIDYQNEVVNIINPYAFEGVSVAVENGDVIVTSIIEEQDLNYVLSGSTNSGSFKIYSEKRYNVILNNVNITNNDGPAINLQAKKKCTFVLNEGTISNLTDGQTYADAPLNSEGEAEDQKAALFGEDKIIFTGEGSLVINGVGSKAHGLASDDEIQILGGKITINSAVKDGIHGKDGVIISGGEVVVHSTSDAIDGDEGFIEISGGKITTVTVQESADGLVCDSTITISGGEFNITHSGPQSKGLKADMDITISGGDITINSNGAAVLEELGSGYDPSYCSAIKTDGNVLIENASIKIISKGEAGKGISADGNIVINSGTVDISTSGNGVKYTNENGETDVYNSTCIKADADLSILGGTVTTNSTGTAGKGISVDGNLLIGSETSVPVISITTSGAKIVISTSGSGPNQTVDAVEAKAIKADGAILIENGDITINSADDGIKSETSITINNGNIYIAKSYEGIESPIININGGTVYVVSSDDALNATHGNGGEFNDGSILNITGGFITLIPSNGDGIDSNGDFAMSGGTLIAHGPKSQPELGSDINGKFDIHGGLLIVTEINSNMSETPSTTSQQYSLKIKSSQTISTGTLIHIEDEAGNNLVTFKPGNNYTGIIFSSEALANGGTYKIYTGGTSTGTNINGLYEGGAYSGGNLKKTVTISSKVTTVTM